MFNGLSFAVKARRLWKRLKRLIREQRGVPVDVIIATYLLKKEKKSIGLCVAKVLERHGDKRIVSPPSEGTTMEEGDVSARDVVGTVLGRYLQHKL